MEDLTKSIEESQGRLQEEFQDRLDRFGERCQETLEEIDPFRKKEEDQE